MPTGLFLNILDAIYLNLFEINDCNEAIKRIVPKIDMRKIENIIMNTPYISDLQKEFYIKIISARKELILDKAFIKINNLENGNITQDEIQEEKE